MPRIPGKRSPATPPARPPRATQEPRVRPICRVSREWAVHPRTLGKRLTRMPARPTSPAERLGLVRTPAPRREAMRARCRPAQASLVSMPVRRTRAARAARARPTCPVSPTTRPGRAPDTGNRAHPALRPIRTSPPRKEVTLARCRPAHLPVRPERTLHPARTSPAATPDRPTKATWATRAQPTHPASHTKRQAQPSDTDPDNPAQRPIHTSPPHREATRTRCRPAQPPVRLNGPVLRPVHTPVRHTRPVRP